MTKIQAGRTVLNFSDLMVRWEWNESDMRDAVINQGLVPSYFISGAVWQRPSNGSGRRPRAGATSVYELMYLDSFHATGALDGYFDRCARVPDALVNGGEVFEVGGVGVDRGRVTLAEVLQQGVVVMAEVERFEKLLQKPQGAKSEKPLSKRERDTLLTIIAVICKEANLDFLKHAKTAGVLVGTAAQMGISIGETTIEGHLKAIPDALASRMK